MHTRRTPHEDCSDVATAKEPPDISRGVGTSLPRFLQGERGSPADTLASDSQSPHSVSSPSCALVQPVHVIQLCFVCRPRPSKLLDSCFLLVLETCAPPGTAHPGLAGLTGQRS